MEKPDVEVTCSRDGLVEAFWSMIEEDVPTELEPWLQRFSPNDLQWTLGGQRLPRDRHTLAYGGDLSEARFDLNLPPKPPPPWGIRFTQSFRRDLRKLDRKLQGRVLETILEITDYALPFKAQGDTFKPLHGELKGQWRYRLGDHRLVIKPLEKVGDIELLTFAPRGSVYD